MEKTMSIKELHKNLKLIPEMVSNWEEITIFKNSKPAFKITSTTKNRNENKYNLKDFKKLQFFTWNKNDKNISENIDKLVYWI